MTVTVEQRPALALIHFSDVISATDLFDVAERLDQIDSLAPGLPRLADATAVSNVRVDFAAMARFARDRKRWSLARAVKTAILVDSDLAFGFARMYQDLLVHPQITVQVFRDREAALAWLGVEA